MSGEMGSLLMKNNKFIKLVSRVTAAATIVSMFAMVSPAMAAEATGMSDTLSRQMVSVDATHTISMTLTGSVADNATITLTYASNGGTDFLMTGAAFGASSGTCVVDTLDASTAGVISVQAAEACSAADTVIFTVTGVTNSDTAGSHQVTIGGTGGVTGNFAIAITTDDQVNVTATVDPTITFNVGAEASGTACATSFSGNGGTVALGTLSTGAITSSDVSSVYHICTRLSTNSSSGAAVTVKSTNAALMSTAVNADTIPSASGNMAAGTANYGLCASSANYGKSSTTPAGVDPTRTAPFNDSCANATAAGTVGGLTTSAQEVWSVSDAVGNGFQELILKAAISGTTKAHTDYTDLLTFVATGTF